MIMEMTQKPNSSGPSANNSLKELRKKMAIRAIFSVATLLLAAVLLFSLTAAWFTNVANTGGLTFVAKKWDFNGSIAINSDAVMISPGSTGIIPMQITNNGAETAAAGITVSKSRLSELMKKRLYFYIDAPFYRNSERMSRVYITENGGYTYTVFPGSSIYIGEDSQNAPALRWEWVYDVLGYYVRGRMSDTGVLIDEYVRPIEYNYDPITTTFNDDGTLATIDGFQTVEEFIKQLSLTDGYAGEIDPEQITDDGYYPVSVNSEGYGVWAYLCTYEEIFANTAIDTAIGTLDSREAYPVEITVTGSNSQETALSIENAETLISVLKSTGYSSLKLSQDITVSEQIVLKSGYRTDIDLNGFTLRLTSADPIYAEDGSKLTLTNGSVLGVGQTCAVESCGGEVVLSQINLAGFSRGVKVSDDKNSLGTDSRVHIADCKIDVNSIGVFVYGNGGGQDTNTTLIVERSEIVGQSYAGIVCNGTYPGTDIQVKDSIVRGYYTSIYHPQNNSTLTIQNSTLKGITGLVIKGGTVNIDNCVIMGEGTVEQIVEPQDNVSGFSDTGDGIYVESTYGHKISVNVTGDKTVVTSANAYAVRKFAKDELNDIIAGISLSAGTYSSDIEEYLAIGYVQNVDEAGKYIISIAEVNVTE